MRELASHLGVDWRLFFAQAANFLILFFIFKKFALGPLIEILRSRRREIAKGLVYTQKAEERLASAEQQRDDMVKEARAEALAIVSEAGKIAKKKRDEIMAETRKKTEEIAVEAKRRLDEERAKQGEAMAHEAEALVRFGITRVLGHMAPTERDSVLIREALQELSNTVKES